VKPAIVQVTSIHDVESSRFVDQLVHDVHVVGLCWCNNDDTGDIALEVQQGVNLDSALGVTKVGPREERKAEVDGCGVQSISCFDKVYADTLPSIEMARALNEDLREIPEYSPVSTLVGVGQGAFCNVSTYSCVIQLAPHGSEAGYNVSQTLSESQLSEHHSHEVAVATENPNAIVALVSFDALVELVARQKIQQLSKYYSSLVHGTTPRPLSGEGSFCWRTILVQIEKSILPRRYIYS